MNKSTENTRQQIQIQTTKQKPHNTKHQHQNSSWPKSIEYKKTNEKTFSEGEKTLVAS